MKASVLVDILKTLPSHLIVKTWDTEDDDECDMSIGTNHKTMIIYPEYAISSTVESMLDSMRGYEDHTLYKFDRANDEYHRIHLLNVHYDKNYVFVDLAEAQEEPTKGVIYAHG